MASNTTFWSPPTITFELPCTIKAFFTKNTHLFPPLSLSITLTEIFWVAVFATFTPITVAAVPTGASYTLTPVVPTEPVMENQPFSREEIEAELMKKLAERQQQEQQLAPAE